MLAISLVCPKSPKFLLSYYFLCFVLVDLCSLLNVNKCPVHFRVYIQSGVCIRNLEVLVLLKITVFGKVTRKQYLDDSGSNKSWKRFWCFWFCGFILVIRLANYYFSNFLMSHISAIFILPQNPDHVLCGRKVPPLSCEVAPPQT